MLQDKINQLAEEKTNWLLSTSGGLHEVRDKLREKLSLTWETANRLVEDISEKCRAYTLERITKDIENNMMKGAS